MVRKGFSLIEVLIVITIISVLMGIGYVGFEVVYKNTTINSKLSGITQNLFYLLVDARRGAVIKNRIHCIKFENGKFSSFVDEDLDGISDDGKKSEFSLEDSMEVYLNGNKVNNFLIYTYDGFFLKNIGGYLNTDYSNLEIEIKLEKSKKIIIENSLPKMAE
ncbi:MULTISPECIES: prepilin-type N-terminal cleavage/methylation domain-containing protein [unclassified Thermosipho (in: thermotogales)]|uniref:prepilin-type N-terminal cleavage/methylation domain-containing protein n=1 Tax=unclassified Thermosipho (in: thermotogales) TaxID=2676525 RepID=UPI0009858662|nr:MULTISPECIES: prepilin-type N-terminal cleavage/methylation domain-containing protein [unclassified Thermosipho (in: thermotogales)]MBT1247967.1 N-terminal cleavage protein [Thermosipho sp. 1244]OOC46565.1 N-terminal cleavage protein [Thermosipho sp. 1223]